MSVFGRADFLVPRYKYIQRWPVIACDQFTSQPDYWRRTAEIVGSAPSAYHIILPEAELAGDVDGRIRNIDETMENYIEHDVFRKFPESYIYVERTLHSGAVRKGLVGVVDLEQYDYLDNAGSMVRATEKTVISRIPPRLKIRSGAKIECSHVLLLCADKNRCLIENVSRGEKLYDLELMQGGGHLSGWLVDRESADRFDEKMAEYITSSEYGFCFAVGDGNHSLAAAKACWERLKEADPSVIKSGHPARWAMVELENIYDPVQNFEPIHRIVRVSDADALINALGEKTAGDGSPVRWFSGEKSGTLLFGKRVLPVEALQRELDDYLESMGGEIDYIHGEDVALRLAHEEGTVAFLLPAIEKDDLFRSISQNGVLPRKTFSIGCAEEKRYYLECRKILP